MGSGVEVMSVRWTSLFRRWPALGLGAAVAGCSVAIASGAGLVLTATQTRQLPAGRTETVSVAYPDALEYGGARYSGRVLVLPPRSKRGRRPKRGLVQVLSGSPALGGSEFRARVRNGNAPGTQPVRIEVIAQTTLPGSR